MKQLFQYSVVFHQFDKEGDYVDSKVIIEPKIALSKSEKDLIFKITREIPEEFADDAQNVQIIVRNF